MRHIFYMRACFFDCIVFCFLLIVLHFPSLGFGYFYSILQVPKSRQRGALAACITMKIAPPPKKKNTHQCSQQTKSSHFTKSPSGCGSLITPLASCPHGAQQTIRNSWQPRGGGPVLIASSGFVEVFCDLAR